MVRLKIYVYRDMDPEITQGTEEKKRRIRVLFIYLLFLVQYPRANSFLFVEFFIIRPIFCIL
jgi:hypothetical protein